MKYPVTVKLPAKYLGVDVLAQLAQVDDAVQMRVEIRQLKASRANALQSRLNFAEALSAERADCDNLRTEIRQLKASRARLIQAQETTADALAEARERIAALTTELYRARAEVDEFENACTALTGCHGGAA